MERLLDPKQEKQKNCLLHKHVQSLQRKLKKKGIEYDIQVSIKILIISHVKLSI